MKTKIEIALIYLVLIVLLVITLLPFYLVIINGTRATHVINQGLSLVPGNSLMTNLRTLFDRVDIFQGMRNSMFIALSSTFLTVYFSTQTAYGFEFYEFKGKRVLFAIIVGTLMMPTTLGLIGVYKLALTLRIIDTYIPLILPSIASPFSVFFMRQYMKSSVNPAIIDAARMDGARELYIFHKVIIPLTSPAIATIGIMSFIVVWNNYLTSRVLLYSPQKLTLPILVANLGASIGQGDLGAIYAGIMVSIAPVIIMFVLFSKKIVANISAGGVKG